MKKQRKTARVRIRGTKETPRLRVFRSNKYIYAQIIDDSARRTLVWASGSKPASVGQDVAALAKKKKIKRVVFDRGRYKFHGRVRELAEGARKGGLEF